MDIQTKNELRFCIMADMMMNRGTYKWSWKTRIVRLFFPDHVMSYLVAMRKSNYYEVGGGKKNMLMRFYYQKRMLRLGMKLGYTIGNSSFGYGLVIPHYGTIVVGRTNHIGNYAVLHTSTCITNKDKRIGNGLYLATGAKITTASILGNNISIGANSLVNKSFEEDNILLVGMPAIKKKEAQPWYIRDGFVERVEKIERLKQEMNVNL